MNYLLLGILQGITEFLPVSSSGHLVIVQSLLGVGENVAFDTVLHLATALALIIYFWYDLWSLLKKENWRLLGLLLLATAITGVIGFAGKDFFESLFSSVQAVGFFLLATGIFIMLGEWFGRGRRKLSGMTWRDAVFIGLAQGVAILPGISRSGTTISASLGRDFEREAAARFSFLLAIPAILGAGLLQSKAIIKAGEIGIGFGPLLIGFLAAFVSGLLAIRFFMELVRRTSIRAFAYYCFAVGIAVMFFLR
ncbi:MAG: undecaprenyl-diphosphate phosphatase [Candidatus Margulisbacteria bacterium]|nr:undecaprenyl-diphosphate phosphatase [Candidatus Margulisiibacteriota bacterium]MBU1617324.1 undecaprenyl-diphosphate phosphatase [Candidatus Margulisiibacteriota bacterium]MBU1867326.1 undecaprenyl-diphosphate phosphatase [Candidatus Margulisiibacteriota bacterium]